MSLLPPPSDDELLRRAAKKPYQSAQNTFEQNRALALEKAMSAAKTLGAVRDVKSPTIALGPNSPLRQKPRVRRTQPEYDLQCKVVAWCRGEGEAKYPGLARIISVPNSGGYSGGFKNNIVRVQRAKLAGVAVGFPDLFLPLPRTAKSGWPVYGGAMAETKREGEQPREEQWEWLRYLKAAGYYVTWYDNFEDGIAFFSRYMEF